MARKNLQENNVQSKGFNQLCVLEGTLMPKHGARELEQFFEDEMGVDVRFET